jgi:hypothetical protein
VPDDKNGNKDRKTRQEIYKDVGYKPKFPEVAQFTHIITYVNELGIAKAGFHGHTALEWRDIESWVNMTHTCLETWEARFIIELSKTYCSCLNEFKDPMTPAPYKPDDEDELTPVRKVADSKIRGLLNGR